MSVCERDTHAGFDLFFNIRAVSLLLKKRGRAPKLRVTVRLPVIPLYDQSVLNIHLPDTSLIMALTRRKMTI